MNKKFHCMTPVTGILFCSPIWDWHLCMMPPDRFIGSPMCHTPLAACIYPMKSGSDWKRTGLKILLFWRHSSAVEMFFA